MAPVEKILPSGPWSTGSAVPRILLDGLCLLHVESKTWLWLCLPCQFKDMLQLSQNKSNYLNSFLEYELIERLQIMKRMENNLPLCLLQSVSHCFNLLEMTRHVCRQDHLNDQAT